MARRIIGKTIGTALIATLFITSHADRAQADLLKGAAAIGILCATNAINCRKTNRGGGGGASVNSAARQQGREVQTALNGFGWNVGTVDGVLGKRSRAAISNYQGYMGYPQTGQLSDWERNNLVDSWAKYQAGAGAAYPRTMAAEGARGMLNIGRDPNYASRYGDTAIGAQPYNPNNVGAPAPVNPWANNNNGIINHGNTTAVAPTPTTSQPTVNQPALAPDTGGQVIGATTMPQLKPLKPLGQVAASPAARCELVDQTTRIQGGVMRATNMTDPNQALSEKFCEARGFAITQGQSIAAQYAISDNEMTGLCEQIASSFSSEMSGLPNSQQAQVVPMVKAKAAELGLADAATMSVYGQICLGIGYRLDNSEMALAGALTLMAAGGAPYGELIGHHLREGFGVSTNENSAVPWYVNAMDALEQGYTPVFVPSTTPERIQVIRTALQVQSQRAAGTQSVPTVVPVSTQLPLLTPKN